MYCEKTIGICGSGTEYLAVAPEGDLYPCHQFVGEEEYRMGSVFSGIENAQIREDFANCNVYTKPECKKCWAKFYCAEDVRPMHFITAGISRQHMI